MNELGIMEKLCSGVNPVTGKLLAGFFHVRFRARIEPSTIR